MEAIESVTENIPVNESNATEPVVISQRSFAVSIQQVNLQTFSQDGQTFSVNIGNNQSNDIIVGDTVDTKPIASISLPNNLLDSIPNISNSTRITNAVFLSDSLFLRRDDKFMEVGSVIISATVVGVDTIQELNPPVTLTFQIINSVSSTNNKIYFCFRISVNYHCNVLIGIKI